MPHESNIAAEVPIRIWHQRLAHLPVPEIVEMVNEQAAIGITTHSSKHDKTIECQACAVGKATRRPFQDRHPDRRSTRPGRVLHVDLCGPMATTSMQGCRFAMPIVDEHSRFVTTCFLNRKSDAADALLKVICEYENFTENRVSKIQADNGGEFTSHYLQQALFNKGIRLQTTIPYTPEQNGLAERMNRTLVDRARTMLHHAGLPDHY